MPLKAKVQFPSTMADSPPDEEHLCFLPAYEKWRKGDISWEQYLHHALLHWTGMRHEVDRKNWRGTEGLYDKDPFGFALWTWQHEATGVRDVSDLEAVFKAYETGIPANVDAKLSVLTDATRNLLERPLALLALQQRKLGILRLCLEGYSGYMDAWPPRYAFRDMANAVDKESEPELYDLIEKSEWRTSCPRRRPEDMSMRGD